MLSMTKSNLLCSGHLCTTGDVSTELTFSSCRSSEGFSSMRNLGQAKTVIKEVYGELEAQALEDRRSFEKNSLSASSHRGNVWEAYTDKERLQSFMGQSMEFVRNHPDCRMRTLTGTQLRFLVMLQHLVSEDTNDFCRPESERKHMDTFEGFLTDGVNSQLIKDSHRSEWSIEGKTFTLQNAEPQVDTRLLSMEEQKLRISSFQHEFVTALEEHLLAFCRRKSMTPAGTRRLLQSVTTQMSQCGLANLDRSSQASRYFVHGQGLEQRTAYNISTMDDGVQEALKLSMLCMKTGFSQYHTEETLGLLHSQTADGPKLCKPSSYLYQYATLRFAPRISGLGGSERVDCVVIDALDEVHIEDVE